MSLRKSLVLFCFVWSLSAQTADPVIPPLKTTITVSGTIDSETPASITTLGADQIQAISGTEMDDRLRQVPGFSLFRRSSSLVANPTTQGVSLRAMGANGASRTLVLLDSLPLNDPFGGWVYWDRIDPNYIGNVDIDRGASTSVFGDGAMGGAISLFSKPETKQHLFVDALRGNQALGDVSAGYTNLWGKFGLDVHSRGFTTDGNYIVPQSIRGRVDDQANLHFATGDMHADYLGEKNRFNLYVNILADERNNGTLLTKNSSAIGTIGGHYTRSWSNDQVSVVAYHTQEQFHSNFSSVAVNRNSETLSSKQTVPVQDTGGAAYWRHHSHYVNTLIGSDVDDTHGTSFDYSFNTHILTPNGGTLLKHGVFGEGDVTLGKLRLFAGIRHEFTGQRGETFVSPNGGATLGLGSLRLRASGYKSFRAPTLNELYRPFRVGNVVTLANSALVPESVTGVEAGADWSNASTKVSVTVFRNELDNLVDNATLTTTKTLITRQRENFPAGLSRGVEANVTHHWRFLTGDLGYMYADARLSSGYRIPQIPKQTGSAQLTFNHKDTVISGGLRAVSLAFDDDLNQFLLPGFATIGLTGQQKLTRGLSAVASVDNLLNRAFIVALTPNPNIGSPQIWRVGLRWNGGLR